MDEELKQLDLATAQARRLAATALDSLRAPQATLRSAAVDYVESVGEQRLDASRRASVEVIARFSDDELAELRLWTTKQMAQARETVEEDIESCDFWIPDAAGLSPTDVSAYSSGLVPRPKDSRTGVPQSLVQLFDEAIVKAHGLDTLRFGDIVAITNADHRFGRIYRTGAVTIGVIAHSQSHIAGHGPGFTTLFTSSEGKIEAVVDPGANLAKLLKIRALE